MSALAILRDAEILMLAGLVGCDTARGGATLIRSDLSYIQLPAKSLPPTSGSAAAAVVLRNATLRRGSRAVFEDTAVFTHVDVINGILAFRVQFTVNELRTEEGHDNAKGAECY